MQQGSPPLQEADGPGPQFHAAGRRGLHRVLGVGVAAGPGHSAVILNRKPKPQAQVRHGCCEDSPSSAREKSVMLQARGPMLEHHIGLGGHVFQARGPMLECHIGLGRHVCRHVLSDALSNTSFCDRLEHAKSLSCSRHDRGPMLEHHIGLGGHVFQAR